MCHWCRNQNILEKFAKSGREAGFCIFFQLGPSFTHHIQGRQALLQYGRRRLPGEREDVQGDLYVDVTSLGLFCP